MAEITVGVGCVAMAAMITRYVFRTFKRSLTYREDMEFNRLIIDMNRYDSIFLPKLSKKKGSPKLCPSTLTGAPTIEPRGSMFFIPGPTEGVREDNALSYCGDTIDPPTYVGEVLIDKCVSNRVTMPCKDGCSLDPNTSPLSMDYPGEELEGPLPYDVTLNRVCSETQTNGRSKIAIDHIYGTEVGVGKNKTVQTSVSLRTVGFQTGTKGIVTREASPVVRHGTKSTRSGSTQTLGPEEDNYSAFLTTNATYDKRIRNTCIIEIALMIKAEKGLLQLTESNMLMVKRMVSDKMADRGMRPTHIAKSNTLCMMLVFVPLDSDVEAKKLLASWANCNAHQNNDATWWSILGWTRSINPLQ